MSRANHRTCKEAGPGEEIAGISQLGWETIYALCLHHLPTTTVELLVPPSAKVEQEPAHQNEKGGAA